MPARPWFDRNFKNDRKYSGVKEVKLAGVASWQPDIKGQLTCLYIHVLGQM